MLDDPSNAGRPMDEDEPARALDDELPELMKLVELEGAMLVVGNPKEDEVVAAAVEGLCRVLAKGIDELEEAKLPDEEVAAAEEAGLDAKELEPDENTPGRPMVLVLVAGAADGKGDGEDSEMELDDTCKPVADTEEDAAKEAELGGFVARQELATFLFELQNQ